MSDGRHAQRIVEAAGASDLRSSESGGISMRIGETTVRWRRDTNEIYAVVRRRTTISFGAGSPEPTLEVPISLASPTPLFLNTFGEVDPTPWLIEVGLRLVASLKLQNGDQLTVGTNQSFLRLHDRSTVVEEGQALAAFAALVESLPRPTEAPEPIRLPEAVKILESFVEYWAIRDDDERVEAVDAASDADLKRLWRAVGPLLPTINGLLDDDGDLDPGAQAAGHLALAALGAQEELERRNIARGV